MRAAGRSEAPPTRERQVASTEGAGDGCNRPGPWPSFQRKESKMNATATRKPRQRRTHEQTVKVLFGPAAGNPMLFVRLTVDGKPSYYWVSPLASDFGKGFR